MTNASLTVLGDPLFTIVFLVAMWLYSPLLFVIVALTLPAYVIVSLVVTGPLRRRLDEKFARGAANNALLVESVSGMPTLKAAAVEPHWKDRWARQARKSVVSGKGVYGRVDLGGRRTLKKKIAVRSI